MAAPRRVRRLYQIRRPSQKFETAFNKFYDDVGSGRIADDLHDAELMEFLDFLDEVRCYSRRLVIVLIALPGAAA